MGHQRIVYHQKRNFIKNLLFAHLCIIVTLKEALSEDIRKSLFLSHGKLKFNTTIRLQKWLIREKARGLRVGFLLKEKAAVYSTGPKPWISAKKV